MQELQARHGKEQQDLQSRITQKKKSASKKTRKGVNDECDRLKTELKQKQQDEVAASSDAPGDRTDKQPSAEDLDKPDVNGGDDSAGDLVTSRSEGNLCSISLPPSDCRGTVVPSQIPKRNRQKERLARRAAEQQELAKQAAEEAKDLPDLKQQEREEMRAHMEQYGLHEKEIRADGHCLYSAVADQLERLGMPLGSAPGGKPALAYKTVRVRAAEYIEQHPDDFVPFLEEPLHQYLHKVRETGEWGGQLELMALAKSYNVEIDVLQADGRVEKIQPDLPAGDKTIWLGYYKHGFGLGEHYNSLRKAG